MNGLLAFGDKGRGDGLLASDLWRSGDLGCAPLEGWFMASGLFAGVPAKVVRRWMAPALPVFAAKAAPTSTA